MRFPAGFSSAGVSEPTMQSSSIPPPAAPPNSTSGPAGASATRELVAAIGFRPAVPGAAEVAESASPSARLKRTTP